MKTDPPKRDTDIILTDDLRLWTDGGDILGPVGRNGTSQLQKRGVAAVGMKRASGVVDNLLRLDLVSDVPLVVSASFEETGPGEFL